MDTHNITESDNTPLSRNIDEDIEEQLLQSILQESLVFSLNKDVNINDSMIELENNNKNTGFNEEINKNDGLRKNQDIEYEKALKIDLEKNKQQKEKQLSPRTLRLKRLKFFDK